MDEQLRQMFGVCGTVVSTRIQVVMCLARSLGFETKPEPSATSGLTVQLTSYLALIEKSCMGAQEQWLYQLIWFPSV